MEIRPRTRAILTEMRYSADSCAEYALVVATEISGPAQVYSTPSASRAIVEETTFTIAIVNAPACLARRMAASVSAVSPDWLITMHISFLPMIGFS